MKKFKLQHPTDRVLISLCVLIIGALIAVLWFYGERMNVLWNSYSGNASPVMNQQTQFYIQNSIKGITSRTPVDDPILKRVYFPETGFYIPQTDISRDMVYGYYAGKSDIPTNLTITTSTLINRLPQSFNDVPCLQRHMLVTMDSKVDYEGNIKASVNLQNGHTLNIYSHNDGNCSDSIWSDAYSASDIIDLLKQAKSY